MEQILDEPMGSADWNDAYESMNHVYDEYMDQLSSYQAQERLFELYDLFEYEYRRILDQYSLAYRSGCEWYVGEEFPPEVFFLVMLALAVNQEDGPD